MDKPWTTETTITLRTSLPLLAPFPERDIGSKLSLSLGMVPSIQGSGMLAGGDVPAIQQSIAAHDKPGLWVSRTPLSRAGRYLPEVLELVFNINKLVSFGKHLYQLQNHLQLPLHPNKMTMSATLIILFSKAESADQNVINNNYLLFGNKCLECL